MSQATAEAPAKVAEQKAPGIFFENRDFITKNIAFAQGSPDGFQPYNAYTGKPFQEVDRLRLAAEGHSDPRWMSESRIEELGMSIKQDAQGAQIYFTDDKGFPKSFTMYNGTDIEGMAPYQAKTLTISGADALRATAEKNGLTVGKEAAVDDVASMIVQKQMDAWKETDIYKNIPEDQRRSPEMENLTKAVAVEFLKADHGIDVDVLNLSDAIKQLPEKTTNRAFCASASEARYSVNIAEKGLKLESKVERESLKPATPVQEKGVEQSQAAPAPAQRSRGGMSR